MSVLGLIPINTDLTPALLTGFTEAVDDQLTTMLVAGSGVTITHNEGSNTFTIASTGGGGGGTITAVTDTNTVDLTISGTTLSADLRTTSTPQVASVGVGRAAMSSTCLALQGASITERIVDDTGHGANQVHFGTGPAGQRYHICHGSSGAPVTTQGPTFKISRYENYPSDVTRVGADGTAHTAFNVVNVGGAGTTASVNAGTFYAASSATTAPNGTYLNPDTAAVIAYGHITGTGVGFAIGIHCVGARDVGTNGSIQCQEIQCRNFAAGSGAGATPSDTALFSTSTFSRVGGLGIILNDAAGGGALEFRNTANFQWNNCISFKSENGGPAKDSSIADYGTALYSYLINGTHATAAIAIASTAGKLLVGATSTGIATKAMVRASADSDRALFLQANSATQSAAIFEVGDGTTGAEIFSISNTRVIRALDCTIVAGTTLGLRVGSATSQKVGLYGVTPVVQATAISSPTADVASLKTAVDAIRVALTNIGLTA